MDGASADHNWSPTENSNSESNDNLEDDLLYKEEEVSPKLSSSPPEPTHISKTPLRLEAHRRKLNAARNSIEGLQTRMRPAPLNLGDLRDPNLPIPVVPSRAIIPPVPDIKIPLSPLTEATDASDLEQQHQHHHQQQQHDGNTNGSIGSVSGLPGSEAISGTSGARGIGKARLRRLNNSIDMTHDPEADERMHSSVRRVRSPVTMIDTPLVSPVPSVASFRMSQDTIDLASAAASSPRPSQDTYLSGRSRRSGRSTPAESGSAKSEKSKKWGGFFKGRSGKVRVS